MYVKYYLFIYLFDVSDCSTYFLIKIVIYSIFRQSLARIMRVVVLSKALRHFYVRIGFLKLVWLIWTFSSFIICVKTPHNQEKKLLSYGYLMGDVNKSGWKSGRLGWSLMCGNWQSYGLRSFHFFKRYISTFI